MTELLRLIAPLYECIENFIGLEDMKEGDGEHLTLADKLTEEWQLFEDWTTAHKVLSLCGGPWNPKARPDGNPLEPDQTAVESDLYSNTDYHES